MINGGPQVTTPQVTTPQVDANASLENFRNNGNAVGDGSDLTGGEGNDWQSKYQDWTNPSNGNEINGENTNSNTSTCGGGNAVDNGTGQQGIDTQLMPTPGSYQPKTFEELIAEAQANGGVVDSDSASGTNGQPSISNSSSSMEA